MSTCRQQCAIDNGVDNGVDNVITPSMLSCRCLHRRADNVIMSTSLCRQLQCADNVNMPSSTCDWCRRRQCHHTANVVMPMLSSSCCRAYDVIVLLTLLCQQLPHADNVNMPTTTCDRRRCRRCCHAADVFLSLTLDNSITVPLKIQSN